MASRAPDASARTTSLAASSARIERIIREYCDERLHAALGYIEPKEVHFGNPERRKQLRADKLALGRQVRREGNKVLRAQPEAARR